MAIRERAAILASKDCKLIDDKYFHFGTKDGKNNLGTYDRRLGYDSTNSRLELTIVREGATSPDYARGLYINGGSDSFFAHTGAHKSRLVYLSGTRAAAVAGGDSNDMMLEIGYDNTAVNTPAGHYARGISVGLNNKTAGEISNLEGAFISVRQRSTGAVAVLEGMQIDCKVDASKAAITSELTGARVEFDVCANAPDASYGFVARNRTDGVYTTPMAAFKAINDATSGCKGWQYGLDLGSGSGVKTVELGDIRTSQQDANGLPCVIFTGTATSDGDIVTDVGADTLWADGSIYISVVDGAGTLWQKRNDTWTSI